MKGFRLAAGALAVAASLGGCTAHDRDSVTATAADDVFDASRLHAISLTIDNAALTTMLQTYVDSGEKDWAKATVTIDGETYADVGVKLKGNSSLRGVTTDTPAEDLPLRIRLDKYVDGQNVDGFADFAIRSNSSETAMNEAVALDLLADAGLASEDAIATRFSVNGSDQVLRLTVQNPDDTWLEQNFPKAGKDSVLYKSEADGDWSWRGTDGDYTSSFDIEAGDDNYQPLIGLLDLVDNGSSAEIAKKLPTLLDIDSFAEYLAFEDAINNFDDIDGPGNNSYLMWDSATKKFTVVAWDHNLAFGGSPGGPGGGGSGGGGPGGGGGGGGAPGGGGAGGRRGAGMTKDNPLVNALQANKEWSTLYQEKLATLKSDLLQGGDLTSSVDDWSTLLNAGASDLVSEQTIASDADKIRSYAG